MNPFLLLFLLLSKGLPSKDLEELPSKGLPSKGLPSKEDVLADSRWLSNVTLRETGFLSPGYRMSNSRHN